MTDAPDPRPRPAYGEYATPEEQRARITQPDATHALSSGMDPAQAAAPAFAPVQGADRSGAPGAPIGPATTAAARPTRTADRIITFVLLGYGLVTVISAIPQMLDIDGFAQTFLQTLGVDGQLADPAAGAPWGFAAAAVLGVGWLLTAVLSWRSVAAGRITWWIPLVAGIVFNIASATLVLIPILSDPVVWSAIQSTVGG